MATNIPSISPILADLSQDIAGAIPLELILLWNTSDKTVSKHQELLEPHLRTGIVVSSDSSGLSKLSAERSLLEVMQLVSQPKEIIYSYGRALGGNGIGLWVADNTEMFYDASITPQAVVEAMVAAQHEIKKLTVQVGIGIHQGTFIEIGGGLYGEDATYIEELAENHVGGGEIAITHTIKPSLMQTFSSKLVQHPEYTDAFLLHYDAFHPQLPKQEGGKYPYPFSDDFFDLLRSYDQLSENDRATSYHEFSAEKVVVLVKIQHSKQSLMLNELTSFIVANAYINQVLKDFPNMICVKSNGDLGIFVSENSEEAIVFAQKLHEKLSHNDFIVNIGISAGEVLLFPLQNGYEIAGGAVNIASKLAEDSGVSGKILAEASVPVNLPQALPFSFVISKVEIKGKYL